jgi:hypothetical protein
MKNLLFFFSQIFIFYFRHLSSEKSRLEQEMEKLLEANIELATESKRLLGKNHKIKNN